MINLRDKPLFPLWAALTDAIASNLRSAATNLHCHQVDNCALFGCATSPDHFSPNPMVGSRWSAAPALIPTVRAPVALFMSSPGVAAMVHNLVTGLVVVALIIMGVLAYAQKHEGCLRGRSLQTFEPCGSVGVDL